MIRPWALSLLLLVGCSAKESDDAPSSSAAGEVAAQPLAQNLQVTLESEEEDPEPEIPYLLAMDADTTFELMYNETKVPVHVKSAGTDKTILLLHGWNLPATQWCEKTALCDSALAEGYNMVMPDFGKSTYQWEMYPETRKDYLPFPTREWMYTEFMRYVQDSLGLLHPEHFNAVVGLSTGGRGAAFFALEHPDVFNACVALSGDYDQSTIPSEPINNGYYGSYEKFPERWEGKDNIYNRAEEWRVPVYLGHGTEDKVCPLDQTVQFAARLIEVGFEGKNVLNTPVHGHDYNYWGSETVSMFEFFDQVQAD